MVAIKVANIVFALSCDGTRPFLLREQSYRDFYCSESPDVSLDVSFKVISDFTFHEEDIVFDSGGLWRLYRADSKVAIVLGVPLPGEIPCHVGVFDRDFKQGKIYSCIPEPREFSENSLANPLGYPLGEILMISLLAQGRGLMVHACGIDDNGRGYLFAGNSAHGKSTMARLWEDSALILNDDRIVLRRHDHRFWIYGTPWHGNYSTVSSKGTPLEKIFFLQHAESNSANRKDGASAASMLLSRCFPPLWDTEGMSFTLDFCTQLVDEVPCYKLGFIPDRNVMDFVRCEK
ncbi:MAG TPA: hypothetical protein DCP92_07075 [Nitrospiraceae bacterium]|nr:hypothetical protein [Nitrospiraceae bacterium]